MRDQFIIENGRYGDTERTWYVWLCSNYIWGRDNELLCYIGDVDILDDSSRLNALTDLAEHMNAVLLIPAPLKTGWNICSDPDLPNDYTFLNHLYRDFTDWLLDGYSTLSAKRYLIGQKSGGAIAAAWLAEDPLNFTAAYFSDVTSFTARISPLKINFANAVPVWFNGCPDLINNPALTYWKMVNQTDREEILEAEGDYLRLWTNSLNPAKRVLLSEKKMEESFDFYRNLYDSFFNKLRRWRYNYNTGIIAWSPTDEEMKIQYVEQKVSGFNRSWYYHIPDTPVPKDGFPVVIAYHGMKTNGKYYLEQSEWDQVAVKNQFIILAPQGYHNAWNADENPNLPDDCHFTLVLLEWLEKQTTVNRSRIYAVGFSLGGAMVNRLLLSLPWLFAAGCAKSGQLYDSNVLYDSVRESGHVVYQMQRSDLAVPLWQIMGEDEDFNEYMGDEHVSTEYWLKAAHACALPTCVRTYDHVFDTRIYAGRLSEYRFTYIKNIGHACYPGEAQLIWTEFFEKLSRPACTVTGLSGKRLDNGQLEVFWSPPEEADEITGYLITSENGRQVKEQILDADCFTTRLQLQTEDPVCHIIAAPIVRGILSRSFSSVIL